MEDSGFFSRHGNVYLYVPNLIGYLRVGFSACAFANALHDPSLCFIFYLLSFVCDELDGRFARMLDQTSTLGAVLDMVTDRLSTAGLLSVLCTLYPSIHVWLLGLLALDIASHWFQMYSTLAAGATTHKDADSASFLVRAYYRHRLLMGYACVSCELLYLAAYLLAHERYRAAPAIMLPGVAWAREPPPLLAGVLPGMGRVPIAALVGLACLPGFALKQLVNCVQLRAAMDTLVALDQQRGPTKKQK